MRKPVRRPFCSGSVAALTLRLPVLEELTAVNILMTGSALGGRCHILNNSLVVDGSRMALDAAGLCVTLADEKGPHVFMRIRLDPE